MNNIKICKIDNGRQSFIMEVDKHTIIFQGFDNADYFEKHYKELGYEIVRSESYRDEIERYL